MTFPCTKGILNKFEQKNYQFYNYNQNDCHVQSQKSIEISSHLCANIYERHLHDTFKEKI